LDAFPLRGRVGWGRYFVETGRLMNLKTIGLAIACVLLAQVQIPTAMGVAATSSRPDWGSIGESVAVGAAESLRALRAPSPSRQHLMSAPRSAGAITIAVPLYKQTMNLDCETASLEMALAYRGHWYSQAYMFQFLHADTRPPVKAADGSILQWGNPFVNFVGNVNGAEHLQTGYGVYYPPVLWIANGLGDPSATGGSGYSASTIYQAVATGHPVQVWVEYQWVLAWNGVWKAWDNTKVHYSLHEHTVVLSGVSDTQVRVNDPWPGTQYWIDKSIFERSWADFYNMAIIY
jgi:uncharacterized protein YvpB